MFKLARPSTVGFMLCVVSACTAPSATPQNVGPPAPVKPILYFTGTADTTRNTLELVVQPPSGSVKAQDTLGYGNAPGEVYFHTCSAAFDSSTHIMTGNVQGVNLTSTNIGSFNAIIDNITVTGATITDVGASGIVGYYGNAAPNSADCDMASTDVWSLTDVATNTNFSFSGHAEGTPALSGEVLGWLFDEPATMGGFVPDFTGNSHQGTISGGLWHWVESGCHSNSCLSFPAGVNRVSVNTTGNLLFGTNDFTVASWIQTSSTTAGEAVVATNAIATDAQCDITTGWLLETNNGLPTFGTFAPVIARRMTGTGRISGTTAINDGNWHQLVGRRTGTTIDLIVDGVIVKSATLGAASYNSNSSSNSTINVGTIFGGSCTANFIGSLDSVRFFSRALSLDEIQGI